MCVQLLQAITRAKKLDIHFLQRISRELLNGNVRSENLDQVPLDSNSEKTAELKDSRQPMSVLGIRICSELGAEGFKKLLTYRFGSVIRGYPGSRSANMLQH